MLKRFTTILIFLSVLYSFSQEMNWSIEASFPYTFGDNFVDEGYNGALDLGVKYRIQEFNAFDIGASFNVGAFLRDDSRFDNNIDASGSAVLFQPRVFASFQVARVPKLHPIIGIGYSIFAFSVDGQNFAGANFQENSSDDGINLNLAIAYDITDHLLLQLQYDYINLSARDAIDTPYNKNVNIMKLGFGYRF